MDRAGRVERRTHLGPRPQSAQLARQSVLEALTDAQRPDLVDVATLLVSELVTNAVVHAHTDVEVLVVAGPDGVRVEVHDGSPVPPVPRHYGGTATTGRGLELVELLSDRHGTAHDEGVGTGKTVWFELGTERGGAADAPVDSRPNEEVTEVTVHLTRLPVLLALAWQQHADALLRELVLSQRVSSGPLDDVRPGDRSAAGDAFSTVAAALEALGPVSDLPPYVDLELHLRDGGASDFGRLDVVLDHVTGLAERGLTLAPPTQPEIRLLRRWICDQVRDQSAGLEAAPWAGVPPESPAPARPPVRWDPAPVLQATEAVIAGDDANRIVAASPAAMRLLGWDEDLIGQRLVAVIPMRLREAHIASFTMHLLTGEEHIIGREVAVSALRRDGSEIPVMLLVQRLGVPDGRVVFTATMRTA